MADLYKIGAVSSLISQGTKSNLDKSKEQKKLDKLFGSTSVNQTWSNRPISLTPIPLITDVSVNKNDKKKEKDVKNEPTSSKNLNKRKRKFAEPGLTVVKKSKKFLESTEDTSTKNIEKSKTKRIKHSKKTSEDSIDELDKTTPSNEKKKKKNKRSNSKSTVIDQMLTCDTNEILCGRTSTSEVSVRKRNLLDDLDEKETENVKRPRKKRDKSAEHKTIFVGNLPLTITKKELRKRFSPFGKIENLRFRGVIPADLKRGKKFALVKKKFHAKCKSINAYICFEEKESVEKATQLNGTEIDGLHIRVNKAGNKRVDIDHKRSVFVGNLRFDIHEQDLREHFLDCGSISNVRVVRDWKTGIGKGFGYILFEDLDGASFALQLDNSVLRDRKIRVKRSESDPEKISKAPIDSENSKGHVKTKTKKIEKKEFVGIRATIKKKKKNKPKHLSRKSGTKIKEKEPKAVVKTTGGPNKHMVFE